MSKKMTYIALLQLTIISISMILSGCDKHENAKASEIPQLQGKLILTGSSTVAPLANEIAKRFEAQHPGVRIDVQTGGSSRGIADSRRGTADIGMASRALKSSESDLTAHTIAMDGVGMILHQDNPIKSLTDKQILDIYTGKITHWSKLGGTDNPITVINKAEGRATLEVFLHYFKIKNENIKPSIIIGENQQAIRTVAGDPNAIGYVSIGTADYEASHGIPIRLLPINGIKATVANVRKGVFPMSRPLNLVTHGKISPLAAAFIAFASSSQINDLVEAQYFVPIAQ
ncbi:MAG: phosphate ABC transporter substrate-binding protein [Phycisphaeraceae bacterium]|nr:phosphate ABC transporter substrate-binding protein [Phycisphaeraceae bacterium]